MRSSVRTTALLLIASIAFCTSGCFAPHKATPDKLAKAVSNLDAEEVDYDEYVSMQNGMFADVTSSNEYMSRLGDGIYCTVSGDDIEDILKSAEKSSLAEFNELLDQYNQYSGKEWHPKDLTFGDYDAMTEMTAYTLINYSVSSLSYCYITSFEFDSKSSAEDYYAFQTVNIDDVDELFATYRLSMEPEHDEGTKNGIDYFIFQLNMNTDSSMDMKTYALILRDGDCVTTCLVMDMMSKRGYKTVNKVLEEMGIFTLDDILK